MTASDDALERWHELAAELQAYRDALYETWGDLDDVAVANYIAGRPTDDERIKVERAIREKPAVREMINVVRNVLEPTWIPVTTVTRETTKQLISSIQISLDDVGDVVASGIDQFLKAPQFADIRLGQDDQEHVADLKPKERVWEIPLEISSEDPDCVIVIRTKPAIDSSTWQLSFGFAGGLESEVIGKARFALTNMADPELPMVQGGCSMHSGTFHELATGVWELKLEIGDAIRIIPIQLGSPSNASEEDS